MATSIAHTSKGKISRMIRNEFDSIDFSMDWIYGRAEELIHIAKSYDLLELAEEMQNDLNN